MSHHGKAALESKVLETCQNLRKREVVALEGTKGPPQTALLMITQQQMEDTSQLDRLPLDWLQWLDRRSVWSLFVCGRTTALSAGFLAFTGRMYLQH